MKKGYSIRILPTETIVEDDFLKQKVIKEGAFSDIPVKMPIRKKVVNFAKRTDNYYTSPVYAVLYADDEHPPCCVFIFRFVRTSGACDIARCVGKTFVKKRWKKVREHIQRYREAIEKGIIDENSYLSFD